MKNETLEELLNSSTNKKILLLGREGLFTPKEIERFFKKLNVELVIEYSSELSAIIEHSKLNPFEEDISNMAYDDKVVIYKLVELEKLLSESINDDELLMGIKLANDQSRVFRILGNAHISNELFIKLLTMYEWHEDEEDNKEDRDVIMYTLRRYISIKPNEEDLLYSYLTLRRLATEAKNPNLLLALINFPNFKFQVRGKQRVTLRETIARNPNINEKVISKLISLRDLKVDIALASNSSVDVRILNRFLEKNSSDIDKSLATNSNINNSIFQELLNKEATIIELLLLWQEIDLNRLKHIEEKNFEDELFAILGANENLNRESIERLIKKDNEKLLINISKNPILEPKTLEDIYRTNKKMTFLNLCENPSTPTYIIEELFEKNIDNSEILSAIAHNKNTPQELLRFLYDKDNFIINKGLSINPSLPMELLNNLKVDTRLQSYLAQNPIFIEEYELVLDFDGRGI